MNLSIKGININYIQYGKGKDLIFLHGWGQNIQMMKILADRFTNYRITILDLPGFGESDEPKSAFTIYDYVDVLEELIIKLDIKKPSLIAHSLGGRIAICYASEKEVDKLVLFGSPCIRKNTVKKNQLIKKITKLPVIKPLVNYLKRHIGSSDYRNASSEVMRDTLVNIVNQDLSNEAKLVDSPTLLIWGSNDEAVDISEAREMEKLFKDAALIELEGCSHYAYLEAIDQVEKILKNFI